MTRVQNVNQTDIPDAIRLATRTMQNVFDADDNNTPFFHSLVRPTANLEFYFSFSEAHVPGRHLNALLNAEDAIGVEIPDWAIDNHARAAFYSYSGPVALPLNRDRIGGTLKRFLPHNLREGFHALYALTAFRGSEEAQSIAEQSIADIDRYWNEEDGWDRATLEGEYGLEVIEWGGPFITGIARAIGPLVKYYKVTGSPAARALIDRLAAKTVADYFTVDGSFDYSRWGSHTHSTTCVMSSLAQLAALDGNDALLERVAIFYDNGLRFISDDLGWSIENCAPEANSDRGEANNTGDILETALILGAMRDPKYFQDAERILRGHLLPSQLARCFLDRRSAQPGRHRRAARCGQPASGGVRVPGAVWARAARLRGDPLQHGHRRRRHRFALRSLALDRARGRRRHASQHALRLRRRCDPGGIALSLGSAAHHAGDRASRSRCGFRAGSMRMRRSPLYREARSMTPAAG